MFCCVLSLIYYSFYGLIAVFVALISALYVSESCRKLFFTIFTKCTGVSFHQWVWNMFIEHRPIWLKEFSEIKPQSPNEKLNILEVGVAFGANFDSYPDNCRLTALDYNDKFKGMFMKEVKKYPNIELDEYLTGTVDDMHQFKDNTFDAVLITHVFCCDSVVDVQKALKEVKRVLKEGGQYFFMEHVGYHQVSFKNNLWSLFQYVLEPLWRIMMGGCCLTQQTWTLIENTGFKSTKINHSYPENFPGFLKSHIWGSAMK